MTHTQKVNRVVTPAATADLAELTQVAAATFGLACPPSVTADDRAAFIAQHLSYDAFAAYLADPQHQVVIARTDGSLSGYAMVIGGGSDDSDISQVLPIGSAVHLSKLYVLADHHRTGVAAALMDAAIAHAYTLIGGHGTCGHPHVCDKGEDGSHNPYMWLGVNQKNYRAQKFYRKQGFTIVGTRTFQVGSSQENDFIMVGTL